MTQVAEKVVLYRFRTGRPMLKVERVVKAIERIGNFGLEVQREDGVVVFRVNEGLAELDRCHLENIIANAIKLLGRQ